MINSGNRSIGYLIRFLLSAALAVRPLLMVTEKVSSEPAETKSVGGVTRVCLFGVGGFELLVNGE